jgi:hypothetical protein
MEFLSENLHIKAYKTIKWHVLQGREIGLSLQTEEQRLKTFQDEPN